MCHTIDRSSGRQRSAIVTPQRSGEEIYLMCATPSLGVRAESAWR